MANECRCKKFSLESFIIEHSHTSGTTRSDTNFWWTQKGYLPRTSVRHLKIDILHKKTTCYGTLLFIQCGTTWNSPLKQTAALFPQLLVLWYALTKAISSGRGNPFPFYTRKNNILYFWRLLILNSLQTPYASHKKLSRFDRNQFNQLQYLNLQSCVDLATTIKHRTKCLNILYLLLYHVAKQFLHNKEYWVPKSENSRP